MLRRGSILILLAVMTGCGESRPSTPAELGAYYVRAAQYDDAIIALDQAIQQNATDAEALVNRGRAYYYRGQAGDLDRAIEDLTAAIRERPENSDAYYTRSLAYRDRGSDDDLKRSQEDQANARKFDPVVTQLYATIPEQPPEPAPVAPSEQAPTDNAAASSEATAEEMAPSDADVGSAWATETRQPKDETIRRRPQAAKTKTDVAKDEDVRDFYREQQELQAQRAAREAAAATDAKSQRRGADPGWRGRMVDASGGSRAVSPEGALPLPTPGTRRSRLPQQNPWAPAPGTVASPWQPATGLAPGAGIDPRQSSYQSPYQSPYQPGMAQAAGTVDRGQGRTMRYQPRPLYDRQYSVPTVQPPVIEHEPLSP
jgi:hypothetical protein